MLKKYKFGFDIWALVLFLVVMAPNLFWFSHPAPNDILRKESLTSALDTITAVFQVLMVGALCLITAKNRHSLTLNWKTVSTAISCAVYLFTWIFYYHGIANSLIVFLLCLTPCLAFAFFTIERKNVFAVIPLIVFSVCHMIYGVVNFMID